MADVQGMLKDPAFNKLDPASQREALSRLDPAFGKLSDADYKTFRERVSQPKKEGIGSKVMGQVGEFAKTIGSDLASIPGATAQAVYHPIDTVKAMGQQQGKLFERAGAEFHAGQYGNAALHGAEYLLPGAGPALAEAGDEMARGEVGKSVAHSVEMTPLPEAAGARVLKAFGKLEAPAKAVGKSIYEDQLKPRSNVTLAQRDEMATRGIKSGTPVEKESIGKLQQGIDANRQKIDALTKDPNSPYAHRTIPIDTVTKPVDDLIKRVEGVDEAAANALKRAKKTWEKTIGYVAPTPATQTPSTILGPNGKPIMMNVPANPGNNMATVAQVQQLKQDLGKIIQDSAFGDRSTKDAALVAGKKQATGAAKTAIEKAIPEESIAALNKSIETDIRLKDSITAAVKRNPNFFKEWGTYILGAGAAGAAGLAFGAHAGELGAITAITAAAARNPRVMSRLAIALDKGVPSGVKAAGKAASATSAGGLAGQRLEPPPKEDQ